MPQAQIIRASPQEKRDPAWVNAMGGFTGRMKERFYEERESDALKEHYAQFVQDGENLQNKIQAISADPRIGPTTRVNTMNQLLQMQKYNQSKQKQAYEKLKADQEAQAKKNQVRAIEAKYKLPENSLAEFDDNPAMAARMGKPDKEPKVNQADRPIEPEQQSAKDKVMESPEWEKATLSQKEQLLARAGVSASNIESTMKPIIQAEKIAVKSEKEKRDFDYRVHNDSAKFDDLISKEANSARVQLAAIEDVEGAIDSVSPYDFASVLRNFGEKGKALSNAIATKDQTKIIQAVPAFLEGRKELFGIRLSDADLRLLQDKLPDVGKSKEANKAILNAMKKYSRLAIAKEKIARNIKKQSKGLRGLDYADQVAETFEEMKKPVKIVTPQGRVISIPAFELEEAVNSGAQVYNG